MINLDDYFKLIETRQPQSQQSRDLAMLNRLVLAHLTHFPYNNMALFKAGKLPIQSRTPQSFSIKDLMKQFTVDKKSGYCFQTNYVLGYVLQQLNFNVSYHLATVINKKRANADEILQCPPYQDHMVLVVKLKDKKYIIDVGFANNSLRQALPLEVDSKQTLIHSSYYLDEQKDGYWLDMQVGDGRLCLYHMNKLPTSTKEITAAHDQLYTDKHNIVIRDEICKLACVTYEKRKQLVWVNDNKQCFFKSIKHGQLYKHTEIKSFEDYKNIAKKKFDCQVDESLCVSFSAE